MATSTRPCWRCPGCALGLMPHYGHVLDWLRAELDGLTEAQLDFDDRTPDREWMWWSIQPAGVPHRLGLAGLHPSALRSLLWPDGEDPRADRVGTPSRRPADEVRPDARRRPVLGGARPAGQGRTRCLVADPGGDRAVDRHLRATAESVRGTDFWKYVIQVLPRGAALDPERPGFIRYDLEGLTVDGVLRAVGARANHPAAQGRPRSPRGRCRCPDSATCACPSIGARPTRTALALPGSPPPEA